MTQRPAEAAIARIEAAILRIEVASAFGHDAADLLHGRHERLRAAVTATLGELDALLTETGTAQGGVAEAGSEDGR